MNKFSQMVNNILHCAGSFEDVLNNIRKIFRCFKFYCIDYKICKANLTDCYGVYIISCNKKVLYIGKGGTLKQEKGINKLEYSKQTVKKRIKNTKRNNRSASEWFEDLKNRHCICSSDKLIIEIICLDRERSKKPSLLVPGFIESLLLNAYYVQYRKLPEENKEL